ncbi:MAG: hypothetical protein Q9214_001172 [Letrouitia sp. 1 TL-2023]
MAQLNELSGNGHRERVNDRGESNHANSPIVSDAPAPAGYDFPRDDETPNDGMPVTTLSTAQSVQQATHNSHYAHFMKPKFARAPIKEPGRVAYLGESSNLSLLVHDRHGTTDVVHYPLPDPAKGSRAQLSDLDSTEVEILHQRGAFLLPPRALCDELVDSFFQWIAPVVPVINRSRFMQRYRDKNNPPSLLLLQAILLAGSRVCKNPQLMDANGSTTPAAMTFYKRAKALYDANYEDDRITIVQALVLMGWYWEGPEGTKFIESFDFFVSQLKKNVARCHEKCFLLDSGCNNCSSRFWHASKRGRISTRTTRQAFMEEDLVEPLYSR